MTRRLNRAKTVTFLAAVTLTGLTTGAFLATRHNPQVEVATASITRGDIVESVSASGTLEAVATVTVGAQVSGTVQALHADFNAIVRKGQVIARLDPSLLDTEVVQARAAVTRAESDVERLRVSLATAEATVARIGALHARQLLPTADLEAAEVNRQLAAVQVKAAEAQLLQARAALRQVEVNVEKTVITSPIDGIVVARNVDVGQTVAASMQAPTLFLIASDLRRLRLSARVDESDIGRIAVGQRVHFGVDAFPGESFSGVVSQVRLQPSVDQNVVTYQTLIDVSNESLKLRPGMTANVTIEVLRRDAVLRVPNAALRFRPTEEMLAALGQTVPETGRVTGGERPGAAGASPAARPQPVSGRDVAGAAGETPGRLWLMVDGRLAPVDVRLGVRSATETELITPRLLEGAEVVTAVRLAARTTPTTSVPMSNPLLGPIGRPGGSGRPPGPPQG